MNSVSPYLTTFQISQAERLRARKLFNIFSVFNTFSYLLLSGNILSLYLLRLGASSTLIGIISSFTYISFFFMLPGRVIVQKVGVSRLFAYCWTARYLAAIPLLFSPIFILRGQGNVGFSLVVAGALGFQVMRGIGLVSNSPIMGDLSEGKDRGDYLSRIQIITHTVSIVAGLLMAFLLGTGQASLLRYSLLILLGILFGLAGCIFLFKLPFNLGGGFPMEEGVFASINRALKDPSFLRFIKVFALVMVVAGITRPFLVLYTADVYQVSDSTNMYLTVVGSLGALTMGVVAQLLLDRVGAKPMLIFFTFVFFLSMIPMVVSFSFPPWGEYLYLGILFFFFHFGTLGQENASQTYFYGAIRPEDQMNLGILYYLIFGLGGTIGSALGGVILDGIHSLGMGDVASYRIFFGGALFFAFISLLWMFRLAPIGSVGIRNALTIMFSARDLRAILLLNKLDRTTSIEAERKVIREMSEAPSSISLEGLLQRLKSPSFVIRREALQALETHEPDDRVVEALLHEVKTGEFTTAYLAARILGKYRIHRGIPLLRQSLHSEDYLLVAESMVALARLQDTHSKGKIEALLRVARNPFLIIHGAEGLKIFQDSASISLLLEIAERSELPDSVRNHVILGIAGLLGMEDWFYPIFTIFLDEPIKGVDFLLDPLLAHLEEKNFPYTKTQLAEAFYAIPDDPERFGTFAQELWEKEGLLHSIPVPFQRDSLYKLPSVAFLLGGVIVHTLTGRDQE